MSFPLAKAQRTQRFLWNDPLSDLGGLARKIPASSYYSLAKAQRTLRFLRNNSLCDLCGLARKIPASSYYSLADSFGIILFATFAAWRERFPQVVIILSQRREER